MSLKPVAHHNQILSGVRFRGRDDRRRREKYDGVVIWYNERRGYGFVDISENERDVFVHLRTLRNCGIHHLTEGQKILLHVTDEGKGPQAKEVKVFATE